MPSMDGRCADVGVLLRGGNQGFEQRNVVVELLRMPLHAEVEAPRWVPLKPLDQEPSPG